MDTINLGDINLFDIGNEIQIAGLVWTGKNLAFITQIPGKDEDFAALKKMPLTMEDWQTLNRQSDLLETEIFAKDTTGITKIILRKTARQLDNFLQWQVFARDNYTCRYCGCQNTMQQPVPLTVDHIDLWEDGGAAILDNLLTACRPCNKDRGRMQYEVWIGSQMYMKKSKALSSEQQLKNFQVISTLPELRKKRVQHVRSR